MRKNRDSVLSHLNDNYDIYIDMEPPRHNKTHKKTTNEIENEIVEPDSSFKNLLEDSAREAYSRPWHRIERGLRLNRLRIFVEEIAPQYEMNALDKENFFIFLQKALDKKLLNTLKVVNYDQEKQRIITIRGLEIKRNPEGILKWGFNNKKPKPDGTRKKRREDIPSVSTQNPETKIESAQPQ